MAARMLLSLLLGYTGFASVSHAGMDRFWTFNKSDSIETEFNECSNLTKVQQQQLIATYQSLRDEEQKLDLKKRMEWFCQLSTSEQQRLRNAWQNMSSRERNQVKKKLEMTTDLEKRAEIRKDILEKYSTAN